MSVAGGLLKRLQARHGNSIGMAMFAGRALDMLESLEVAVQHETDEELGVTVRLMLERMEAAASDGITVDTRYAEDFALALDGEKVRDPKWPFHVGERVCTVFGGGAVKDVWMHTMVVRLDDGQELTVRTDGRVAPEHPYPIVWAVGHVRQP